MQQLDELMRRCREEDHAPTYRDLVELRAAAEDAQGEIRALRATEAGLRERVKELEEGLRLCVHTIDLAGWEGDFTAINARALLEKKE